MNIQRPWQQGWQAASTTQASPWQVRQERQERRKEEGKGGRRRQPRLPAVAHNTEGARRALVPGARETSKSRLLLHFSRPS